MKIISKDEFDDIYPIMEEAFPAIERRSYEGQKSLIDLPYYNIYTEEIDGEVIAFMSVWEFSEFAFIEHFASNHKARGKGIGKMCLEHMIQKLDKLIVLEVELPLTDIAKRRIHFYERLNFHLNTYEYLQPPLQEGFQAYPLYIMSYPDTLSHHTFKQVEKTLYAYVYKLTNGIE